jgi:formylglycine-generating enzyme required for sulfatase activity
VRAEFRLPTEAEWEHACRAGTETSFYTGESLTTDQANYNGDYPWDGKKGKNTGRTVAVGSYPANPWGLYDMAGNVWQWCGDWYGPYGKEAQTDPKGPDKGSLRVFRGGAWYARPAECRPAGRGNRDPGIRNDGYGLRVLVVVPSRGP